MENIVRFDSFRRSSGIPEGELTLLFVPINTAVNIRKAINKPYTTICFISKSVIPLKSDISPKASVLAAKNKL